MFGEGFGLYDEYYEIDTNLALFEPVIFDSTAFPSSPPPPPTHRSEFHKSASSRPASTSIEVSASPNPFNSTVEIRVNNIDTEKLTVAILDIYGKCIRNKFNINMDDKNTSVIWNGTDNNGEFVPSGVYFYIISTARENVPVDCCWLNKSQYKYSYFSPSKFPLI